MSIIKKTILTIGTTPVTGAIDNALLFTSSGMVTQDSELTWNTSTNLLTAANITLSSGGLLKADTNTLIGTVANKINPVHIAHAAQVIGDILYADSSTTLTRLAAVASGSILASAGTGTAPVYTTSPSITALTLTMAASQAANTTALTNTINNTQTNSVFASQINIGTSGKAQGILITGTGSTATTAADKHMVLWGNTAANVNKVLSVGNGTSFTESLYITAAGVIQGEVAGNGLRLHGPSALAVCTLDNSIGAKLAFQNNQLVFNSTRGTFGGGAIAYTHPTLSVSTRYSGSYLLNTTPVGNVGGGTDDLMSGTLFAGILGLNGDRLHVHAWGTFANNANAKQVLLVLGSTTLLDSGSSVAFVNTPWELRATIIRKTSTSQEVLATFWVNGALVANVMTRTAATENLATNLTLKLQAAGTSNDDIQQMAMLWDWVPVPAQAA